MESRHPGGNLTNGMTVNLTGQYLSCEEYTDGHRSPGKICRRPCASYKHVGGRFKEECNSDVSYTPVHECWPSMEKALQEG